MKVLLIDVYNYNKGGVETVCFNTGKMLEEHGHKVVYFTLKWENNNPSPYSRYFPESKETRSGTLRLFKNVVNYFYHFEAARKMEELVKDEKPDIAHIHLIWGQITPSIFPVLKKYRIPILLCTIIAWFVRPTRSAMAVDEFVRTVKDVIFTNVLPILVVRVARL